MSDPMTPEERDPLEEEFEQIAVIGMAGRFPDAPGLDEFWENLRNGIESIRDFSEKELADLGIPPSIYRDPKFVARGTLLPHRDDFDAGFFGMTPREAAMTDPQARILLEISYAALEHAGYDPLNTTDPVGVFAGSNPSDYAMLLGFADPDDPAGGFERLVGTEKDFLATRISHHLNLTGPALAVQTACSTSLVAIHLASQSLLGYECSMALAGGVSINLRQGVGHYYQEGMILSPDGHCRAFDAQAAGTVLGQGCGVVVLKRLSEAMADGDTIHAIIKATAINNDGSNKVSYTAPSEDGQAKAIAAAQALAGVSPDQITYVETHGTGTVLGDPVEVAALTRAFSAGTDKTGYCAIGSVKTNIGHADAASGVAGFIKTVLALSHAEIPPSLHFSTPNPNIDFENSPFFVNTELRPWKTNGATKLAGLSSFGAGGTNAHAVLEEAPPAVPSVEAKPFQLLMLSARTPKALTEMAENLADHLDRHPNLNPGDVAYTLQVGRPDYEHRSFVVAEGDTLAGGTLLGSGPHRIITSRNAPESTDVVFMFSGQGAQYPGMAHGLYQHEPRFREDVDHCAALLEPLIGRDLRRLLFPESGEEETAAEALRQTAFTQPALFTVEWALAQLYLSWGITPAAVVGHSIGEYVAAALAGIFTLEDALRLVARRGRLMQDLPGGSMLAVQSSASDVERLLSAGVELAASNSSRLAVVSGDHDSIKAFQRELAEQNIDSQILHTSHAFHSHMMEPILAAFAEAVGAANPQPPQLPMLSNVTGTWLDADQATDPEFWASQIRRPVRFVDNIRELLEQDSWTFLELGPGRALATFVRQHEAISADTAVVTSIRHPKEDRSDVAAVLEAVGQMWLAGLRPDWDLFYGTGRPRRIPLPGYPFQRERFWAPSVRHVLALGAQTQPKPDPEAPPDRRPIADWAHVPSWRTAARTPEASPADTWLCFGVGPLGARIVAGLEADGRRVVSVLPGDRFERIDPSQFTIDPANDDHYQWLMSALAAEGLSPDGVVHAWSAYEPSVASTTDEIRQRLDEGANSVIALARALGKQSATHETRLEIVTVGAHRVTDTDQVYPSAAALLGPCKVIPLEYSNLDCRNIDLAGPDPVDAVMDLLLSELRSRPDDLIVAIRDQDRWISDIEPLHLPEPSPADVPLKQGGVYLLVGGLGGVGLSIGRHLAEQYGAKLALVSRSGVLEAVEGDEELARRIEVLHRIEETAEEVMVLAADAVNESEMRGVVEQVEQQLGPIDGVVFSAAVLDDGGTIHTRSRADAERVIESKVFGPVVLDQIFAGRRLDFILLCSSNSSLMYHERFGQVGYLTANAFAEAFPYAAHATGSPLLTVAWDDWVDYGISVRATRQFHETYGYEDVDVGLMDTKTAMSWAEGVDLFERLLAGAHPVYYISTTDLRARISHDAEASSPFLESVLGAAEAASDGQRQLAGAGGIEELVVEVWRELLGIDTIGENDDFFALGGDSLQVARMADRLGRALGVAVPINLIFEVPTVGQLANRLADMSPDVADGQIPQQLETSSTDSIVEGVL